MNNRNDIIHGFLLSSLFFLFSSLGLNAVNITQPGSDYIIDNGKVAVRVPAGYSGGAIPPPIKEMRYNGSWYGSGSWNTTLKLEHLTATKLTDGVKLYYTFESKCGIEEPYAEIIIKARDNTNEIYVEGTHRMNEDSKYTFEASAGWDPAEVSLKNYDYWAFGALSEPSNSSAPTLSLSQRDRWANTLKPYTLFYMQPRWTQSGDAGYFALSTDNTTGIGVGVCRAGKWHLPHDNYVWARTSSSGGDLYFDFPTRRGSRYYLLVAGTDTLMNDAHSIINSYQSYSGGPRFYSSTYTNPTSTIRSIGDNLQEKVKNGNLPDCEPDRILNYLNADFWGYPDNTWSPINPNFYTDLVKVPALKACGCEGNPKFDEIKSTLKEKLKKHMRISFAVPGGAGECPGYHIYAYNELESWAPLVKQYVGIDIMSWKSVQEGGAFIQEVGRPPQGDTHPPDAYTGNLDSTKEYPLYGVVFVGPGTLDWKSGPMRGHYHGDQLSFHWWNKATDHQVSYCPRADQEHMHNRVSFAPSDWNYANMDGYERIIAYNKTAQADVAMGQVENDRLRKQPKYPDDYVWQGKWAERKLDKKLIYRRTMIMVKGGTEDYFVIRDQHWGPDLNATFNIHTKGSKVDWDGTNTVNFGNMSLFFAQPSDLSYQRFDYDGQSCSGHSDPTIGARFTTSGSSTEFVTVMYPDGSLPPCSALSNGVTVGDDTIRFYDNAENIIKINQKVVLTQNDIDLNRSQGKGYLDVNNEKWDGRIFVPEVGYPMGSMPDWLLEQRVPGYIPEKECTGLQVSSTVNDITCNGDNNGSIMLTVSGGSPAYKYSWNTGDTTQNLTGLSEGTYKVTVIDASPDTITRSFTIEEPGALSITGNVTDVSHNGGSDGKVDVTVSGGVTPYTYSWNNLPSGDSIYEAENGTLGGGAGIQSDSTGFSGTGYVELIDNIGSFIEWNVQGRDQKDSLSFKYANTNQNCGDDFNDGSIDAVWNVIDVDNWTGSSITENNGHLTLTGRGADVYQNTNEFIGIWRSDLTGNFDVSIKIVSQTNTNDWAKTGIMVADDITDLSQGGFCLAESTVNNGYRFEYDTSGNVGEQQNGTSGGTVNYPGWVRLKREGDIFTAYYKTNENDPWTQIGSGITPQQTGTNSEVCLFMTSHDPTNTGTVEMDHFNCGGGAPIPLQLDINNTSDTISFQSTSGKWDTLSTVSMLTEGANTIGLETINNEGIYLDYLKINSNMASKKDLTGVPSGTYDLTVKDHHGCQQTKSFTVEDMTSIRPPIQNNNNANVKVYPLPAEDRIQIEGNIQNSSIEMRDVLGNILLRKPKVENDQISLDVSGQPAGIYTLEIQSSTIQLLQTILVE